MVRAAPQPGAAVVAILFGLATIWAGLRVLWVGSDPGKVDFRPLLIFNTVMGAVSTRRAKSARFCQVMGSLYPCPPGRGGVAQRSCYGYLCIPL